MTHSQPPTGHKCLQHNAEITVLTNMVTSLKRYSLQEQSNHPSEQTNTLWLIKINDGFIHHTLHIPGNRLTAYSVFIGHVHCNNSGHIISHNRIRLTVH